VYWKMKIRQCRAGRSASADCFVNVYTMSYRAPHYRRLPAAAAAAGAGHGRQMLARHGGGVRSVDGALLLCTFRNARVSSPTASAAAAAGDVDVEVRMLYIQSKVPLLDNATRSVDNRHARKCRRYEAALYLGLSFTLQFYFFLLIII